MFASYDQLSPLLVDLKIGTSYTCPTLVGE
ncbi:hypothetical protein AVEN_3415-1, partial [Araneus ventricosus]